jgi:hypothetical protein
MLQRLARSEPNPGLHRSQRRRSAASASCRTNSTHFAGIATNAAGASDRSEWPHRRKAHAVGNDPVSIMGGTYHGAGITIGPAMHSGSCRKPHGNKGSVTPRAVATADSSWSRPWSLPLLADSVAEVGGNPSSWPPFNCRSGVKPSHAAGSVPGRLARLE